MAKVWVDQDICTGDGLCALVCPDIFFMHHDGLAYVRPAGSPIPETPTHEMGNAVDIPDDLVESTVEAAEDCPGQCIFVEE